LLLDFFPMALFIRAPFPNQRDAGNKIYNIFTQTNIRYTLLRADVQSGKTGVYQYLVRKMLDRGIIDRAYIVCGSHELELIKQCKEDITEWHPERNNGEIQVIFRQDFDKVKMNIHRALIVVDETHLVMDADQTLSAFLQRHGLTLKGTLPEMQQNDTFILSVDATPFVELSAMVYEDSHPKKLVVLENGPGYFGPQHYRQQGFIQEIFDFREERFIQLVEQFPQKYFLIRIAGRNGHLTHHLRQICQDRFDIVHFTSDHEKGSQEFVLTQKDADAFYETYRRPIHCLETAPARTTIVIVDGRLRCGKRLHKNHIAVVWETSQSADTDVILQGLLGRVSGYDVPADRPLIFLPPKCIKPHENDIIGLCDLERAFCPNVLPRYAKHLLLGPVQKKAIQPNQVPLYPCVPIPFQLSPEDTQRLTMATPLAEIAQLCLRTFSVDMVNHVTEEQRREITQILAVHRRPNVLTNIRRFRYNNGHDSHPHYYNAMLKAVATNTTVIEHITNYPRITFCTTFPGYQHEDAVPGQVFAVFYTESVGRFEKINEESRIPKQDGKTHFTLDIELPPEMKESPAGGIIGFTDTIKDNPAIFEKQLNEFIWLSKRLSKKTLLQFNRSIVSLQDHPIQFLPAAYGPNLERLFHIKEKLETKHHVRITIDHKWLPGTRPVLRRPGQPFYHEIDYINWDL
jgi:hypothetical protein